jgi:hypothetical protein
MRVGRASVLRLGTPLVAVLTLAAPAQGGSSSRPDPIPGAAVPRPDAAPTATPAPVPKLPPAPAAPSVPETGRAVAVVQQPVASTPVASTPVASAPVAAARPRHHVRRAVEKPKPRPRPTHAGPFRFEVPPVVLPRFLLEPLDRRPAGAFAALAALALGAAALTALSGAGLVVSWSRR